MKTGRRYKEEIDEDIPKSVAKMMKNKKRKEIEEPEKKKHPRLKKFIIFLIIVILIILIAKLVIATHRWKTLAKDMLLNENSIVKDTDGNIIATLGDEKIKNKIS